MKCPNCGSEMNTQSKSGDCILGNYNSDAVPASVAHDANRHAPIECEKCKKTWEFDTSVIPKSVNIKLPIKECKGE